jgi:hypothetical protein
MNSPRKHRLRTGALVTGAVVAISVGLLRSWTSSETEALTPPRGLWRTARSQPAEPTALKREQIARLEALGYVAGSEAPSGLENVVLHSPKLAYQGLNLLTSGHAPEALLTDMEGRVLHH